VPRRVIKISILRTLRRDDLVALTEEAAKVSGIAYVMDAYRDAAEAVLDG
jgi:hypothetical protein